VTEKNIKKDIWKSGRARNVEKKKLSKTEGVVKNLDIIADINPLNAELNPTAICWYY
jgi:hypothetical protein